MIFASVRMMEECKNEERDGIAFISVLPIYVQIDLKIAKVGNTAAKLSWVLVRNNNIYLYTSFEHLSQNWYCT